VSLIVSVPPTTLTPQVSVVVNFTTKLQTMQGFGACNRDDAGPLTSPQLDIFFNQNPTIGIGLSILRTSIYIDGTDASGSYADAGGAVARGARIISTPWTAPAGDKTPASQNGGVLNVGSYSSWASVMCSYQANLFASQGVNCYAIGMQNEPDESEPYDSMVFSASQANAFIKVLGPIVQGLSPVPLLMMPESASWSGAWGYTGALDSTAQPYVNIAGAHQYAGVSAPSESPLTNIPIWMTEMSDFNAFDPTITHGLTTAGWVHDAITTGQASLWCYWMLIGNTTDNQGLTGENGVFSYTKRLYTLGNYSAFVRPGYQVVGTSGDNTGGITFTAYQHPSTGAFAIVVINNNTTPTILGVTMNGASSGPLTPWVTSAQFNLVAQPVVPLSGSGFTYVLPASSVTTFVNAT
jgi:glucuronoarabinoxylan endo-1,4-beta-xylanase